MSQIILIDKFLDNPISVTEQQLKDNLDLTVPTTSTSSPEFYALVSNNIAIAYYPDEDPEILTEVAEWVSRYYASLPSK